ncbi:response regulator [Demequina maris]|uniref:response regulator n=1 Tax=Demequina maris TaxID=1638982 RepID=UPI000AE77A6A|nr:response regulator transcription factor [Demequina maris]
MIAVGIVDDEAIVRSGVALIVRSQPDLEVAGEADDLGSALALARELSPDVMLVDLHLGEESGLDVIARLLASASPPRVIVLTTFDADENVYRALRAGASGFVVKSSPPEHLVAAIRAAATGDMLISPPVTRRLIEAFLSAPSPAPAAEVAALTDREVDVWRAIARGQSNDEIAASLFMSVGTVKSHINHLYAKLGVRDRAQAVIAAYESGAVRVGDGG